MTFEAVTAAALQVRLIFYIYLLVSIWCPVSISAADIPALVQKAKPAIVEILTYDQQNKLLKTGTGFFISSDGVLLTNYHVISGGSSITAKMPNGAVFFLKSIVTASEAYDVAKLQFVATDVPYLTLGSSSSAVEGQRILVIGNPEGLEGTVSDGIISAFRASRTMIQITAPVSPGSSGSPVLDESGNVIGIATQVLKEGQNLNFAISAETIRDAIAKSTAGTQSPPSVAMETPTPSVGTPSAEYYLDRAVKDTGNENWEGAIVDYTEAIRLEPDNSSGFSGRATAYDYLKQYRKAVSDYTEAIRLELMNPSESRAVNYRSLLYFERGGAYSSLKQYAEAVSDYTEAIRLKPDSTSAYWARGNAYYYGLKEYKKAISDYAETIRLWPSNPMFNVALIYECRAAAYEKLGDRSRAAQDRKKAKELKRR